MKIVKQSTNNRTFTATCRACNAVLEEDELNLRVLKGPDGPDSDTTTQEKCISCNTMHLTFTPKLEEDSDSLSIQPDFN